MQFPTGGRAILDAMFLKFEAQARGTEDERRLLTFKIAQTFTARFGPEWGTKRTTINHPPSKDALARIASDGYLDIWDWQNGSTRLPLAKDGHPPDYAHVAHVFIKTPALDWLADVPVVEQIETLETLDGLMSQLEKLIRQFMLEHS